MWLLLCIHALFCPYYYFLIPLSVPRMTLNVKLMLFYATIHIFLYSQAVQHVCWAASLSTPLKSRCRPSPPHTGASLTASCPRAEAGVCRASTRAPLRLWSIANITENAVLFLSYGLCQDVVRFLSRMDRGAELRLDTPTVCFSVVCPKTTSGNKACVTVNHDLELTSAKQSGLLLIAYTFPLISHSSHDSVLYFFGELHSYWARNIVGGASSIISKSM